MPFAENLAETLTYVTNPQVNVEHDHTHTHIDCIKGTHIVEINFTEDPARMSTTTTANTTAKTIKNKQKNYI